MTGGDRGVTPDELERRLQANPRFRPAPASRRNEVTIRFTTGPPKAARTTPLLPLLRDMDPDGDDHPLQLHLARPAALQVTRTGDWGGGGPLVIVRGIATRRVRVTDEVMEWFAGATEQRGPFGRMVLTRHGDAPEFAEVTVEWAGFMDGLTEDRLAIACRAVGEGAKSCCVQLVNRFGAAVPTTY